MSFLRLFFFYETSEGLQSELLLGAFEIEAIRAGSTLPLDNIALSFAFSSLKSLINFSVGSSFTTALVFICLALSAV